MMQGGLWAKNIELEITDLRDEFANFPGSRSGCRMQGISRRLFKAAR
jgi:hypothetical protein